MKNRITQFYGVIKDLSIFANLAENELQEILKNARIEFCKKKEILFLRDQKAVNFYVVLDGLVKLSASDPDGKETILKIINPKKLLSDIFSDVFIADAQAIEDCVILSLPIERFRESVKNNTHLVFNMLLNLSSQNKELFNQLEQLKLGNAKQKVGQFLLGMAFEKGDNKEKNIDLKYDKSMIASYLGMKPETLSRTLKGLKKDGEISVKKNVITLSKMNSLCKYCDSIIFAKCSHRESSFCEQN